MNLSIPDFTTSHVMIVGDVMLDQYWHGQSKRISPEAPVPVVHVRKSEYRAGGASNVALNIQSLQGNATLLGLTGADHNARQLESMLSEQGVSTHFQACDDLDTCLKLRVIAQHQQMIRLDFEDHFAEVDKQPLYQRYQAELANHDIVILSDYNKGTLSEVQQLIRWANEHNTPTIVDPKGTDFEKYRDATLMTPNRNEFEAVVGHCKNDEDIVTKGEALRQSLNLDALLITRGEEGMTLISSSSPALHLPTYAREVFDVTGAGDTVIGVLAASLGAGIPIQDAVAIANLAAGLVVRKLGTAPIQLNELYDSLHQAHIPDSGIVDEMTLAAVIKAAQHNGERIIMTNGCFDLLHTGHVTYLQQARALGDRLVVAVNSDASVTQLKGASRPINALAQRMSVLAALECVDWVIPFTEETPERLYCHVLPDVIVKGGDYEPHQVAGGECVVSKGGKVEILSFVDGQSTTDIIRKIRENVE